MRTILIRCLAAAFLLASTGGDAAVRADVPAASVTVAQLDGSPTPSPAASPDPADEPPTDGSGGIRIPLPLGLLLLSGVLSAGLVVGKLRAAKR